MNTSHFFWGLAVVACFFGTNVSAQDSVLPAEKHPVLMFTSDDVPMLKERVKREPYATWWNSVKQGADAAVSAKLEDVSYQPSLAKMAKNLAFAYVITEDEKYAARAVDVFKTIKLEPDGGDWGKKFLPQPEGAADLAQSYDMIQPWLTKNRPDDEAFIRKLLYAFGEIIYSYVPGWYSIHFNNHQIRQYCGLAIVSFAIAGADYGRRTPCDWYHKLAKGWIEKAMNYQICAEGAFAEGHNYHEYSAPLYIPFFYAARNFLDEDRFRNKNIVALHEWSVKSRMPAGQRPNFDDAALCRFPSHMLTGAMKNDGGLFRWDWENGPSEKYAGYSAVDSICFYDDSVSAKSPVECGIAPSMFSDENGDLIFRSGWEPDAVYMCARAENGKARKNGGGHEHPDETSFIIHAFGELLCLDGGYVDWEYHRLVNTPDNHNLITVDGKGSAVSDAMGTFGQNGSDAFGKNFKTSGAFEYCEIHAKYQSAEFQRCIVFIQKRYFVVVDFVASDSKHVYEWRLHGNGGGTTGGTFEQAADGALWRIGKAQVRAWVFGAENPLEIAHKEDEHSFTHGKCERHEVLTAKQSGKAAVFVSVLFPGKSGGKPAAVSLQKDGGLCKLVVNDAGLETVCVTVNPAKLTVNLECAGKSEQLR